MMTPTLDIELFRRDANGVCPPAERIRSQDALLWFMEALCLVNQAQIRYQKRLGKPVPPLYSSGVRYQREDGTEDWQDIHTTLRKMWGDCEDLACYRVAELREVYKRPAAPFVTWFSAGPGDGFHYHALLWAKAPDGVWRIEDPSRKLGMGWEEDFADRSQADRDRIYKIMDRVQKRVSPAKLAKLRKVAV